LDVQRAERGFASTSEPYLASSLARLLKKPLTGIAFGSEATRFAAVAEEVVVIGPGDMRTAHSERESVPAEELVAWTDCIKQLLVLGIASAR
jgi:acetylornithine deacetylase